MLLIAILMIQAWWQIANIITYNKVALWISNHNFTFYIYSWPFQAVVMVICSRLGIPWYLMSLFMFIAGFAGPLSMIFVYERFEKIRNRGFDLILGMK